MSDDNWATPEGGLPPQTALHTGRAVFTEAYAVIPRGVMTDIVTSFLPGWRDTRAWIIARPMSGFAETFAHYIMEVSPGGGSDAPEPDAEAEGVLFVTRGKGALTIDGASHALSPGSYAFIPPRAAWSIGASELLSFHWVRKAWEAAPGVEQPKAFVTNESAVAPFVMANTDRWMTTRFVEPDDLRHDMHVNIVTFEPGGVIPFEDRMPAPLSVFGT